MYFSQCVSFLFSIEVCEKPVFGDGNVSPNTRVIYKPNETAAINCDSGYIPNTALTKCTRSRAWDPQPICSTFSCNVTAFENGFYTTTEANEEGTNASNSSITPHCNSDAYSLKNSNPRYCQETERWSGPEPICTPVTCRELPFLENGYYDAGTETIAPYQYNHSVTPVCAEGYYLTEGETLRCSLMDEWLGTKAICTPITCRHPDKFDYGSYNGSKQSYAYASVLIPSCQQGYNMTNNVDQRVCNNPDQWTNDVPICKIIRCNAPLKFEFGNYTFGANNFEYNTYISINCFNGYAVESGNSSRTCQEDGQWSGPEPNCTRITCNNLPPISNGVYTTHSMSPPFDYRQEINPVCHEGFHLTIGTNRSCISHDTWLGQAAVCDPIRCKHPSVFDHGSYNGSEQTYAYGSVLIPSCQQGYNMTNNVAERVCNNPDNWENDEPICEIVRCETPPEFEFGNYTYDTDIFEYNTSVNILCFDGYFFDDGNSSRTCKEDGHWSGPVPNCTRITCSNLPLIDNGVYDTGIMFLTFDFKHEITPVCHVGYYLKLGTIRSCISPDTWEGVDAVCDPITCERPSDFDHGSYNGSQESYEFGSVLVPLCDIGYAWGKETANRKCLDYNDWSGDDPVCTIVLCDKLPIIENGYFLNNITNEYNTTANAACNLGYEFKDNVYIRTCQENGLWSLPKPECARISCSNFSDIEHEAVITAPNLMFDSIGDATYNTTKFFLRDGSTLVRCLHDGKLSWEETPVFGMCYIKLKNHFCIVHIQMNK